MVSQRTNVLLPMYALQCAFSYFYLQAPALAADFTGPIVSVLDGDTIEVLRIQRPERIRLSGIDCPEEGLAW